LPPGVTAERIQANLNDGVLEVQKKGGAISLVMALPFRMCG
jgi:HSP20 family molecular chaperone IbpA